MIILLYTWSTKSFIKRYFNKFTYHYSLQWIFSDLWADKENIKYFYHTTCKYSIQCSNVDRSIYKFIDHKWWNSLTMREPYRAGTSHDIIDKQSASSLQDLQANKICVGTSSYFMCAILLIQHIIIFCLVCSFACLFFLLCSFVICLT